MKQLVKEQEQPGGNGGQTGQGGSGIPGGTSGDNGGMGTGSGTGSGSGTGGQTGGGNGTGSGSGTQAPQNKHFYMSAKLDNVRINKDVNNYVQEIIQHLNAVDGATVELKLEVEVIAPNGIPSGTVRTVSENCRTLKVTDFGFDD